MATTRKEFFPDGAHFPTANFPAQVVLASGGNRLTLAYDAAVDETAYWSMIAPQGVTGALSLKVHYCMASATTGAVYFQAQVEAITPADATDLDAGTSFDTANSGNGTVPATAGYEQVISITLTAKDNWTDGDLIRIALSRDADNASDTATGDALFLAAELQEA